jgi:hypothetical protein
MAIVGSKKGVHVGGKRGHMVALFLLVSYTTTTTRVSFSFDNHHTKNRQLPPRICPPHSLSLKWTDFLVCFCFVLPPYGCISVVLIEFLVVVFFPPRFSVDYVYKEAGSNSKVAYARPVK